ncbi:MAG: SIMPL domain-containing protein [Rhodobacteraceae bacterium]|nr:SIMPL domain-containing protein [Paracoccaceae bacterium]
MKSNRFLVSALVFALSAGPGWAADVSPQRQIAVTGEAHIQVAPSLALISLGVTDEAAQAVDAMRTVSTSMVAVIDRLHRAGLEPDDMQTQQISISPNRGKSGSLNGSHDRNITSFTASNTLQIRVRDLDQLGDILDQVLQAGANEFRGLIFGVADPAAVQDQIRGSAVKDALRKAEQLAAAAGVALGPVMSITDHGGGGGGRPMAMEMARSTAMPVEAGQLRFSHNVSVVFAISSPEGTE